MPVKCARGSWARCPLRYSHGPQGCNPPARAAPARGFRPPLRGTRARARLAGGAPLRVCCALMRAASVFFLSDAHLGVDSAAEEGARTARLHDFLNSLPGRASSLYIVGDLFDFWFEYRTAIPRRHFPTLAVLERLRATGLDIAYLNGNHDFWLGTFFRDTLGIRTLDGVASVETGGRGLARAGAPGARDRRAALSRGVRRGADRPLPPRLRAARARPRVLHPRRLDRPVQLRRAHRRPPRAQDLAGTGARLV